MSRENVHIFAGVYTRSSWLSQHICISLLPGGGYILTHRELYSKCTDIFQSFGFSFLQ